VLLAECGVDILTSDIIPLRHEIETEVYNISRKILISLLIICLMFVFTHQYIVNSCSHTHLLHVLTFI
jgi:ABC-type uncharacterized transport system permease subunit